MHPLGVKAEFVSVEPGGS